MLRLLMVFLLCFTVPALAQDMDTAQQQEEESCEPDPIDYSDRYGATKKRYERRQAEINQMDKDCDGILSEEEREEAMGQRFEEADLNQDGIISKSESEAMIDRFENNAPSTYIDLTGRNIDQYGETVKKIDLDDNGTISAEEYEEYYNQRYKKLDEDGDGTINVDEYRADVETSRRKKRRNRKDR